MKKNFFLPNKDKFKNFSQMYYEFKLIELISMAFNSIINGKI